MKENNEIHISNLKYMLMARVIDQIESEYTARGESFFHVSGAGHESIAVLASLLQKNDWIHSHYRDKALLLARGLSPRDYFLALFNKDASHSHGRQMNAHMSAPELNVLSISGPVGNSTLHAAGVAEAIKQQKDSGIVISILGEGTTFQGEFLESLTLAVRDSLPVLVVVEDNKFAISTHTEGKTFYQVGEKKIEKYLDCEIIHIDGRAPQLAYSLFKDAVAAVRSTVSPKIVIFSVDRLENHTNADNQQIYRSDAEIESIQEKSDPILNLIKHLYDLDYQSAKEKLREMQKALYEELKPIAAEAQKAPDPKANFTALKPLSLKTTPQEQCEPGPLVMLESMREVLGNWLEKDSSVFLYGQDIEDPKGDVFGLTRGLSTAYPDRVVNSPLSESIIVGTSIGRALYGQRPVAFLQFADFFPLAFNQIYSELGSMYWRSGGKWEVPVIILATCGGYRPGLGPFHSSSMESVAAHVPGIDVFIPSNAKDAAGLLNAAFLSGRPTVFFYPKSQLNVKYNTISKDGARNLVISPGKARIVQEGSDLTLVGFGNTVSLCEQVAETLLKEDKTVEVIDLRSLQPMDHSTVLESVKKTGKILITHEDNASVSISSELIARISEHSSNEINCARVVRSDTYVPCNFPNQLEVLPSYRSILQKSVALLGGTLRWLSDDVQAKSGLVNVEAIGSSPSDEIFVVLQWRKKPGDLVKEGDVLVEAEADKSTLELKANVSGKLSELLCEEGEQVPIGSVIARIKTEDSVVKTITREEKGAPVIQFPLHDVKKQKTSEHGKVYISHINTVLGARELDNREIIAMSPEWTEEKIYSSTGIKKRHWLSKDQSLVSISTEVALKSLTEAGLDIGNIDGIVCATGTHEYQTPSLATMVQYELEKHYGKHDNDIFAYDISAACSGFVFVLSDIYNRLIENPGRKFLLLSGEYLSQRVDMSDYQTAPVFSDAATASILSSQHSSNSAEVLSPILQTVGAPAPLLMVPEQGSIAMDGVEVYKLATRHLSTIAEKICATHSLTLNDIDLIVPHQANQKIIQAVARRLHLPLEKFYVNIHSHGNSSSNTIPICLEELQRANELEGKQILLVAFGGGFTFGGTIFKYS